MEEKKTKVKRIFDSIAVRYDLLNHLLSFGFDYYWRKKALKLTGLNSESILLDVACGTGDVAITARKMGIENIFGADYSHNMLTLFNKKSSWIKGRNIQMVAENFPLKDECITNITVAFGVRNFYDIQKAFNSFYKVLKNGGKVTILEFRMPANVIFKFLYKFYFKKILPLIGGLISGEKEAYKYLPASVEEFDEKIKLPELLGNSGFEKIEVHNLTFGITQVVIATK
ncbi:MAG: ubiquinone biosynthesis methyltransferase UbiE [Ignavibacteria bacterium GWA2_35_9]|nr:MAG: ubiquinone biosynthesis methyltransferase UbiE [Ignavibacteria bacterium GWA2_35_9]OGU45643.1 MAG: ubiquinone biosynthesis methyltransferase UbiE [Ignavibacteria bacterium GWB2_36_8]OGV03283.1 MAG: ubiquinone biosynthesis methyltransferase UbiE [Ignavibacteria bacterium RIFOXYB2_FULL_36_7]